MPSQPNVFAKQCPSREIISRVSGKWTMLILSLLNDNPKGFNEIKKVIEGISQKVLTENLRRLERDGLITRKICQTRPIRVEYKTTYIAKDLLVIIESLKKWSERSIKINKKNNKLFDMRK